MEKVCAQRGGRYWVRLGCIVKMIVEIEWNKMNIEMLLCVGSLEGYTIS